MADIVVPPPEQIRADIEHLKDWISKEPHLPSIDDEEWLETFLYMNKFSLEKTKSKLDAYYSVRSKYPEIFKKRDPTGADLLELKNHFKFVFGHKPLQDGSIVVHIKYGSDAAAFDIDACMKKIFMLNDLAYLNKDIRRRSYTSIVDFKDLTPSYALKLMIATHTIEEVLAKAYTIRYKAAHVINFPSFALSLLDVIKPCFPKKLKERTKIFAHSADVNTLFETVDEDVVCSEFGGKGPTLAQLEEMTEKKLEELRDWFRDQESVCSNEELRRKDSNQGEEMRGSFRKLQVD